MSNSSYIDWNNIPDWLVEFRRKYCLKDDPDLKKCTEIKCVYYQHTHKCNNHVVRCMNTSCKHYGIYEDLGHQCSIKN